MLYRAIIESVLTSGGGGGGAGGEGVGVGKGSKDTLHVLVSSEDGEVVEPKPNEFFSRYESQTAAGIEGVLVAEGTDPEDAEVRAAGVPQQPQLVAVSAAVPQPRHDRLQCTHQVQDYLPP